MRSPICSCSHVLASHRTPWYLWLSRIITGQKILVCRKCTCEEFVERKSRMRRAIERIDAETFSNEAIG